MLQLHITFCMAPSFSTAIYFCYKRCDIANYRALKVLYLVCFALTHANLSKSLLYAGYTLKDFLNLIRSSKCERPQTRGQKNPRFNCFAPILWCPRGSPPHIRIYDSRSGRLRCSSEQIQSLLTHLTPQENLIRSSLEPPR